MSTRSNISIEDPKRKKVKVIYVHSDGYPYGVGNVLLTITTIVNLRNYYLIMEMHHILVIPLMSVVFMVVIGRETKSQPERTEMSGCTWTL